MASKTIGVLDQLRRLSVRIDADAAERKRLVLAALHDGDSIRVVAAAAGLSPTTVQAWANQRG